VTAQAGARRRREATREKVAVSIPRPLVEAATREVQSGHATSLSAYVSQALSENLERDRLEAVLDAMDAEYGVPTAEDQAWARRVLFR
jgi:Arc/MetJ-type ribon-helix-helix transcriptional regulator